MLCQILELLPDSFLAIWLFMAVSSIVVVMPMTAVVFRWLYVNATYTKWQYKSNANYPSAVHVRAEIVQIGKAIVATTLWPSLAIYFRHQDWTNGYCPQDANYDELSKAAFPLVIQFALIVVITDFFEFFYHWCGHFFDFGWSVHKYHHHFYNPTPFAVIADEWWDNIWRASPLFWLPVVFSIHMELLWYTFLIFFYCYGIYLHCGYEADWIVSAKNPIVNTSFQHYIHHAAGTRKRPCHCGFFIKLWDQIWGTCYDGPECHAEAERRKGNRSMQQWEKIAKEFPDYSLLWTSLSFWLDPAGYQKRGSITRDMFAADQLKGA